MRERMRQIVYRCCAGGLAVCVVLMGSVLLLERKDAKIQQDLLETIEAADTVTDPQDDTSEAETLSKYAALYAENEDFVGWISIDGTEVNYPVMHTPEDAEYYLHRDFYGAYSLSGTVFASWDSTFSPRSDNVILYGHNMSNGSMFADLLNYADQAYWQEHPAIQFDTLTQTQRYEIVYAFVEDIGVDKPHFEFYNFVNAADEDAFDAFVESCQALSAYDTGITPVYGDQFLTLVTCKGYDSTLRMVVVARAVQ